MARPWSDTLTDTTANEEPFSMLDYNFAFEEEEPEDELEFISGLAFEEEEEEELEDTLDVSLAFEEEEPGTYLNFTSLSQISDDDGFVENEQSKIQKDPGAINRFTRGFLEGLSPVPIDLTTGITPAEDLSDKVAGMAGTVIGFGTGLFASGGMLGGLKIIGTGAKATKALAMANQGYTQVARSRKMLKAANTTRKKSYWGNKVAEQEVAIDKALSEAGVITNNTLLGRQEWYRHLLTRIGVNDYPMGKFMSRVKGVKAGTTVRLFKDDKMAIRAANALDLGLTNIAASGIMFQKTIPIRDEMGDLVIADRITKPFLDGVLMTAGGLPRVLGAGKIGNLALTSKAGKAVEAPIVFATGMGASQLGIGIQGEGERTLSDNLIDGAIFTAAHYIGVGADNMRIKHAIREGLEGITDDKQVRKLVGKAMSNDPIDRIKLYMATKRPEYLRRRFVNKKNQGQIAQLEGIIKGKAGKHTLSYRYLTGDLAGETSSITGLSRGDVLNQFYKDYRNVMPNLKKFSQRYLEKNPNTLKPGTVLKRRWKDSYKEHQKLVRSILKREESLGFTGKESNLLRRNAFKDTYGNMEKMSIEQLKTYDDMLTSKRSFKDIRKATMDSVLPFEVPESFMAKTQNFKWWREFGFSAQGNMVSFGEAGTELARKMVDYADTKNIVKGSFTKFIGDISRDFLPTFGKGKKFNSITALLDDEKLKLIADDISAAKIADGKLLNSRVKDLFDETFVELARVGAKVQVSKKGFVPVLRLYDRAGKSIKISEKSFDNGDVLKILRGKGDTVLNENGKKIIVNVGKSMDKSAYVSDYVPRYLSDKAKKLFDKDNAGFAKNLRAAVIANNPKASASEIDRIVGTYIQFADSKKPLGILNTRKVDIPPYMLIEKETKRVIQLDELPQLSTIKKGASIVDVDGQSRVVGDIVEIYEKDFGKIIDMYSNQVANSMALFRNFDERGSAGKVASGLYGRILNQAGSRQSDYATENLRLLLEGEAPTWYSRNIGGRLTTGIANIYLSGPSAVIKNYLTGQTQNYMSLGTKGLMKGWYNYLASPKFYGQLTDEVGAISKNVDELAFVYKGKIGRAVTGISYPFRAIERLNRRSSVAITDVAMRDSFDSIINNKASTFYNGSKEARRSLKLMMNMDDDNIDYMLGALKKRRGYGDKAFDLALESDNKFRDIYKRGLFKSQASTQGVTQLPYIPTWAAKNKWKPLTLFYRTAYRVTENTYNNAVVPFVTDGNPFPMMRYMAGAGMSGKILYDYYYGHALGKDLTGKNFKEVPIQLFDYAVRGEALGLFSNIADEYGGVLDSYIPVPIQFGLEMYNFGKSVAELSDPNLIAKAGVDYARKNITVWKQGYDFYREQNNDINKKFEDQRRLQYKFLSQYPQFRNQEEKNRLEEALNRGKVEEKPFYFKLLSESLIRGDKEQFESDFLKTRAFLEHEGIGVRLKRRENYYEREVRNEMHDAIKASMQLRLRPYPKKWEENVRGQRFIDQYFKMITPEDKKNVEELMLQYEDRMRLLDTVMRDNYSNYGSISGKLK